MGNTLWRMCIEIENLGTYTGPEEFKIKPHDATLSSAFPVPDNLEQAIEIRIVVTGHLEGENSEFIRLAGAYVDVTLKPLNSTAP